MEKRNFDFDLRMDPKHLQNTTLRECTLELGDVYYNPKLLSPEDIDFSGGWDVEKFRKGLYIHLITVDNTYVSVRDDAFELWGPETHVLIVGSVEGDLEALREMKELFLKTYELMKEIQKEG